MLHCDGISVRFDGFAALSSVSFQVEQGRTHALIGPNGAGKSTLFNAITGHLRPDAGTVVLAGEPITGLRPEQIVRRGLARSFQHANVFPRLTVAENLDITLLARTGRHFAWHLWARDRVGPERMALLDLVGLTSAAEAVAGQLSYGRQKQLELAIAVAARPRLLILDEPTAGMSPRETGEAIALLQRIKRERELTLLFCEHDMAVVFEMADEILVLHHGELIAAGPPTEVRADVRVRQIYLGEGDGA